MPLMKSPSKKAFKKNIEAEMHAGKPQDQSLAIAYSIQRKNKKKKMAGGGEVDMGSHAPLEIERLPDDEDNDDAPQFKGSLEIEPASDEEVSDDKDTDDNSVSGKIMAKRKKLAYGGAAEDDGEPMVPGRKPDDERLPEDEYMSQKMSESRIPRESDDDMRPDEEDYMGEYATRRRLAYGGKAEADGEPAVPMRKPDDMREPESEYMGDKWSYGNPPARKPDDERLPKDEYMADHFSEGGSVSDEIMKRRKYADGGLVDLNKNAMEEKNHEDDLSYDALRKENYSEESALEHDQPMDSNEHGRVLSDEDEHDGAKEMETHYADHPGENAYDMVDSIRRRMKLSRKR